jgi:hypothetical protein
MPTHSILPRVTFALAATAVSLSLALSAGAEVADEVLLEVVSAEGVAIALTRAELEALPQVAFQTKTEWTEGTALYSGPSLTDVLELAGLQGQPVEAVAANDYKVTLTPDLVGPDYPIVALRIDDKPFGLRELGPLWIVYPYDLAAEYRSEEVFAASIWQLVRLLPAGG